MQAPLGFPISDRTFQLVTIAVFVLLGCAIAFTLAAVWLRRANIREQRRWARLEALWGPVIPQILTGDLEESRLHQLVRKGDERYFVAFLLRYARRLKGVEHDAVQRLAAPYLGAIARDLRHRSPERRARALETLGDLSTAEYAPALLSALDDPAPLVAMTAAQALAQQFHPSYAERLLKSLDRFERWNLDFLASMLANMGPDSADVLRNAFADGSRPPRIRAVAARTLAALSDAPALEIAVRVTETERQLDLVIAALGLIERVGGREQLPAVRRLLRSEDGPIRARALRTLARIGEPSDAELIRERLGDDSGWVILHAARALGEMGRLDLLREAATGQAVCAVAAREVLWEAGA